MVRRVAGKSLPVTYIRIKSLGRLNYGQNRSGQLITAPHVKRGKPKSAVTLQQNADFTRFVQALKDMNVYDQVGARDIAYDSAYMFRDVLSRALVGRLIVWGEPVSDDIQTQLDSINSTIGAMLLRTIDGWVGLLPGVADEILTIDNVTGLPSWLPAVTPAAGGLFAAQLSPTPTIAGTGFATWASQPTGSAVADTIGGISIFSPAQGSSWRLALRSKPVPTPPYTVTALISHSGPHINFNAADFGWWNGATTGLCAQMISSDYADGVGMANFTALNPSTPALISGALAQSGGWPDLLWYRLKDDGAGNVSYDVSPDGIAWVNYLTRAKTGTGMLGATGYSHIVFGTGAFSQPCSATLLSYAESSP